MFGRLFGGYTFPYNIGDAPFESSWGAWTHCRGTSKDNNEPVSIFRVSAKSTSDPKLVAARNGVKRLKLLRHPNMLQFKDTAEVEEKGEAVVYLVTEPVTPLVESLKELQLGGQRQDYVAMGLYHIANAVSFLNNDCNLIHGNVCMSSVVVTDSLDWKLHGLDLVSEHQWQGELALTSSSWMVAPQYKPAEVAKGEWTALREGPPWAVDAWGLGCLMNEACSGRALSRTEDLRDTAAIPPPVLQYYQRLLASSPARRLNPIKLLESEVFKTRLVESVAFLENLAVKDVVEKETFFKRLPAALPQLPQPVAERKLLPLLAGALEFGGAPPVALTTLLKIGAQLSEDDYSRKVVPTLSKLFASPDRLIRKSLLDNIGSYGKSLPTATVESQIYPALATGFTDSTPLLRELTLKAMAVLAPKLTQRTLNQSLLKYLAKLQVDEEPSIRANTTILLGNLAEFLSESTCKRVLLNAFTRALKDPFPPARIAGLRAMGATARYYAADEAATRALPAAAPLAIDAIGEVRSAALAVIDAFAQQLKENHRKVTATEPPPSSDATAAAAGGGGLVGMGGGGGGAGGSGWSTWAMSSLGLSATGGGGGGGARAAPDVLPGAATPVPATAVAGGGGAWNGGGGAAAAPAAAAATDGWEDDDLGLGEGLGLDAGSGFGDEDDDAEERAARQRLSRMTAGGSGRSGSSSSRAGSARHKAQASSEGWDVDVDAAAHGSGGAGGGLAPPQSDGLDALMATVSQRPAGAAARRPLATGRGRGRGGTLGARRTSQGSGSAGGNKPLKLGATKTAKSLGDDWGADDF